MVPKSAEFGLLPSPCGYLLRIGAARAVASREDPSSKLQAIYKHVVQAGAKESSASEESGMGGRVIRDDHG